MVATEASERVDLVIEGMTCASCATRIEKKLNRLDGVAATVNFASEHAAVAFDPTHVSVNDLIGTIEAAGYHAAIPNTDDNDDNDPTKSLQASARPRRRAHRAPGAVRVGPCGTPTRVGVGLLRPRDAGCLLRRLAVPPCGGHERPSRRRHDGHR